MVASHLPPSVILLVLVASCASGAQPGRQPRAYGGLGSAHPLEDRIFDVAEARFISFEQLVARLSRERLIVVGERHDNPGHHQRQAQILEALAAAGRRPAAAFEMITVEEQPALDGFLASAGATAEGLGPAVRWEERGWPAWAMYQPIGEVALRFALPLLAANLSRAQLMEIVHHHSGAGAHLGPEKPLVPAAEARLAEIIRDSHCGHATEKMVRAMVAAQRARDAFMAERTATAADAVLFAGDQHARRDFGVPFYWSEDSAAKGASVGLIEVRDGVVEPAAYARASDGTPLFDFAWFTERVDDEDPCERFEEQLRKMRDRHPAEGD